MHCILMKSLYAKGNGLYTCENRFIVQILSLEDHYIAEFNNINNLVN